LFFLYVHPQCCGSKTEKKHSDLDQKDYKYKFNLGKLEIFIIDWHNSSGIAHIPAYFKSHRKNNFSLNDEHNLKSNRTGTK